MPACSVLVSPWTDMAATGNTMNTLAGVDPIIQKESLLEFAKSYLKGADPFTPSASPLYAKYHSLPPILIQVGSCETLLDDSRRVSARLRRAGIEIELEVWDDMIHVWHLFAHLLNEGEEAIQRIGDFVRKQVN